MLMLYRRVVFGPQHNEDATKMKDLNQHEYITLVPLVLLVIGLGIFPGYITNAIAPSVEKLVTRYEQAIASAPDTRNADTTTQNAETGAQQ
ncbi:MAG: hypothetical protein CMH27_06020 [Micavibrio sp.]|nr:hypothetical protein [Micavibrio sp.]